MKFKASILAFILAAVSQLPLAGAETILKGRIIDSGSGEPEAGAVVQFFKADNLEKPVAYTITAEDGSFSHSIDDSGEFVMIFTNVGRKEMRKAFTLDGEKDIDLGSIMIEDDIEMLEAGKVVALKDLIKMDVDHITYKVSDDADAKSSTLLDMLRKVPMVTVDAQDNISVNGSRSFQVLVDGKPNMMMSNNPSQIFKALPANFAKDIQVITNPGVKYDAEGVGGVLNITTNKELTGTTESLDGYNGNLSLGRRFGGTAGDLGSGFITVQKGKFSASANVSVTEATIKNAISESTNEQLGADGKVLSTLKSRAELTTRSPIRTATANVGYELNELNLVSATIGYTAMKSHITSAMSNEMEVFGIPAMSYTNDMKSIWDITSLTGGIDYQKSFKDKPGKSLVLSYLFSSSPAVTDNESRFSGFAGLRDQYTDGSTNTVQNSVQADYTTSFGQGYSFNAGAKYINRLNKSDQALFKDVNGNWDQDMAGSMIYRHDNNIAAAYTEMSFVKGKLSGKGGLRYEHTFLDVTYKMGNGKDFSLDYGNLVPAASVQYNIGMTQNIGLTYGMRISRPGITYLNPYVDNSDPSVKSYGNSELETERAHNLNLVYNYFSNKVILNAGAHVNHTGNAIDSYRFYGSDGVLNSTFGNITNRTASGMTGTAILTAGQTRFILNGGFDYNVIKSEVLGLDNKGWTGNGLASVQSTLPWETRFSGSVVWQSKSRSVDGWTSGLTMLVCGLDKSLLEDKLSLGLSFMSPIGFGKYIESEAHLEGPDYRQFSLSRVPIRTLTVDLTWNFGSNARSSVKKARMTITNDDLMDRSNASQTGTL